MATNSLTLRERFEGFVTKIRLDRVIEEISGWFNSADRPSEASAPIVIVSE